MAYAEVVELPVNEGSNYLGVSIDRNRDTLLSDQAFKLLNREELIFMHII